MNMHCKVSQKCVEFIIMDDLKNLYTYIWMHLQNLLYSSYHYLILL